MAIPMQITGYSDENYLNQIAGPYKMMINPESFKRQHSIDYNERQPPDSSSTAQKYEHTNSDEFSFDLVIDCTGIVDNKRIDMATEISAIEKIVFI